ncbi:MAG: T9SS type A sorting domain-containing protein [Salibacteraceae bacterium]
MKTFLTLCFFIPLMILAQRVDFRMEKMMISESWTVNPKDFKHDFNLEIDNLTPPVPGGDLTLEQKKALKEEVEKRFPRKEVSNANRGGRSTDTLAVLSEFPANFYFNQNPMAGGTPNDNTLAISDGGNLLTSWNSQLWGYDVEADTYLFSFPVKHPSFFQFLSLYNDTTYNTPFPFDPKLLYDPTRDRFIMVFLVGGAPAAGQQGRDPETSATIVCFSSSSDPKETWYAYRLDGNPLSYDTWTDYPQIAINEHSFYLTLNQLYPDSGWVEGFAETVLWQMDLDAAFAGEGEVPTKFWTGFKHEGKNIRYLHPVKNGLGPEGDEMYFIANRPFTVTNDTFFMVKLEGKADDSSMEMDIRLLPSSLKYGHPPYALQSGASQKFWTNDARVLGAVKMGDQIQFTGNSIDTSSGKASIYHGLIDDVNEPAVNGMVFSGLDRELGFPNIAFMGISETDRETVIFCNHTAFNVPAGNSAIYINNDGVYSELQTIKEGETYVDMFSGGGDNLNERWGDYSGIQRKFNATSRVWVSGYWGFGNQRAGTWISELAGPKDWPVAIDKIENPKMHLFPNPSLDYIQLEFDAINTFKAKIDLMDIQGRLVSVLGTRNIQQGVNVISFNTSSLKPGVYLLRIHEGDNVRYQEKFIKD